MKLIKTTNFFMLYKIKKLYKHAFPKWERKPFWLMLKKQKIGITDIFYLEKNNKFCGLASTILYKNIVLLAYFAIDESMRGLGYGSEALLELQKYYKDKDFILEIESTKIPSENYNERIRRKNFYKRNGITETGIGVNLFGVEMEVLSRGTDLTYDRYFEIYKNYIGKNAYKYVSEIKQL